MARSESLPFDLWSLEVFLAVCEAGTMVAAGKRLGLTQPAVSQVVGEMEKRVGIKLLDRKVRPVVPTVAGNIVRRQAGILLSEARQIRTLLREVGRAKFPMVRVGLVDSLVRVLSADLAMFLRARSDHVSVYSGLTAAHFSALFTRQLDMFIGVDEFQSSNDIERWPILTEPYILAVSQGYRRVTSVTDLARLAREKPLVRFTSRSRTGEDIERYLQRLGLDVPRSTEFDSPHGVAGMIRGGGWAITTPLCMYEAGMPNGIVYMPLPTASLSRTLLLTSRRQELGPLPQFTATRCRDLLRKKPLTELRRKLSWLEEPFNIMHD
ncbi:MAG: LysR family transcriptional regulator [Alphaproteobacteria bacterium]|nr:LysR family transcriptional regulator [Alphaproteobacteria bacterium]